MNKDNFYRAKVIIENLEKLNNRKAHYSELIRKKNAKYVGEYAPLQWDTCVKIYEILLKETQDKIDEMERELKFI